MEIEWRTSEGLVDYDAALADMSARAASIADGTAAERIWLLEHPPLYTAGTSADPADLIDRRFPVHEAGRGGQYTYHGPGQRVAYVQLDLGRRRRDVRAYVHALEAWLIAALAEFGVVGETRPDRVGIWVRRPPVAGLDFGAEDKIAAIGVRVRRWVTLHGVAVNVAPDLSHFAGIIPCGVRAHGVTSLAALGKPATLEALDEALRRRIDVLLAGC